MKAITKQLKDNGHSLINSLNDILDTHGIIRDGNTTIVIQATSDTCNPPCVTRVRTVKQPDGSFKATLICCCPGMACF
jgi:hypothetical protein